MLEDPIENRLRQVVIVEDAAPRFEGLVGHKDHRAMPPVPFVDDVEEHVGGVGPVGEVADFVDNEHRRMRVGREGVRELAGAKGRREIVDERGGRGEEGIEAVLDRAVRDSDGEAGLLPDTRKRSSNPNT